MVSEDLPERHDDPMVYHIYELALLPGLVGTLMQDLFLLPKLVFALSRGSPGPPLHPLLSFGFSITRLLARIYDPLSSQAASLDVVLLAVLYFMVYYIPRRWSRAAPRDV